MSEVKPETIVESGITFGRFNHDNVCYLEKSHLVKSFKDGFKRADFIWLENRNETRIYLIEVKSGFPNPDTNQIPSHSHWSDSLRDKLVNAFTLCVASHLGQHPNYAHEFTCLPAGKPFADWDIKFVVVYSKPPRQVEWPQNVQDILRKRMLPFIKKWGFRDSAIKVISADTNLLGLPILSNSHAPQ